MPTNPQYFIEEVAAVLRRLQPECQVEIPSPDELIINGRRLDIENLRRMCKHEPERGTEIVEHYLDQLLFGGDDDISRMSFDIAKTKIMPRIQPVSIFNHLSKIMVAHIPFVNDTVIVFVIDLPQKTVSITTEQLDHWRITVEEANEIARKNLSNYKPSLAFQTVESKEGGIAAIFSEQDGYDAARLLLPDVREMMEGKLGKDFYVAIPGRDMFLAFSSSHPAMTKRLKKRIIEDHTRLPYPISEHLFLVTQDGIAGTKTDTDTDDMIEQMKP